MKTILKFQLLTDQSLGDDYVFQVSQEIENGKQQGNIIDLHNFYFLLIHKFIQKIVVNSGPTRGSKSCIIYFLGIFINGVKT